MPMVDTTAIHSHDALASLATRIAAANAAGTPLRIEGGSSKTFYGRKVQGEALDVSEHRGITSYDPVELIVSVRTGTPLAELEALLDAQGQMLPFEPPHFGPRATVGGMIATGLSGPRRPWVGAVRDFVLGMRVLDHRGQEQRFGGEVMKNVAGYDLSRLMVGAQGTLGLITEVSLKVLPKPGAQASLRLETTRQDAMARLAEWGRKPLPITAAAWLDGGLHLRLEGGPSSVTATRQSIGGDELDAGFWTDLRELRLTFFSDDPRPLWRLSLPTNTPPLELPGSAENDVLHDWAGSQRWLKSEIDGERLRESCARAGGHATCLTPDIGEPFTPLEPVLAKYHRELKARLDPNGIFNPGRLYADL